MWLLYLLTVLAMLATMEVGYRLTRARQRKAPDAADAGRDGEGAKVVLWRRRPGRGSRRDACAPSADAGDACAPSEREAYGQEEDNGRTTRRSKPRATTGWLGVPGNSKS